MSQIEDDISWNSKEREIVDRLLIPMVRDEPAIYNSASRKTGVTLKIRFTRIRNAIEPGLQAAGLGRTSKHYLKIFFGFSCLKIFIKAK